MDPTGGDVPVTGWDDYLERLAVAATIHYLRGDIPGVQGIVDAQPTEGFIAAHLFELVAYIAHDLGEEDPIAYLERLMAKTMATEADGGPGA